MSRAAIGAVREEAAMLAALLACLGAVALTREPGHPESAMWMAMLALQAIPYLAALACEAMSRIPRGEVASAVPVTTDEHSMTPRLRAMPAVTAPSIATQKTSASGVLTSRGMG
jgi:hypothetical protein